MKNFCRDANAAIAVCTLLACVAFLPQSISAETGAAAWLRYAPLSPSAAKTYEHFPTRLAVLGDSPVMKSAQNELTQGVAQMLGRTLPAAGNVSGSSVVIGTLDRLHQIAPALHPSSDLTTDGYWLTTARIRGFDCLVIAAANDRGVLYGVFALLSKIARGERL
ncbi:MAG TPA: alpha-glucuronidase family glycosyl hydrolase, partial [Candidatus Sulfotelmatobacter sp.]|nr:alpha-glucuronidase family glycosyl hydrolase [Candidatus Sulfotelmatobacter sp.]